MLRTTIIPTLCFALAGSAFLSSLSSAGEERKTSANSKKPIEMSKTVNSPEKEGIRLTVQLPKAVAAGSPLLIEAKVVNNGKIPIYIDWDTTDPRKVQIELTTKDGRAVPFTLYGRKTIEPTDL